MAIRKPLVLKNGRPAELPSGDSLDIGADRDYSNVQATNIMVFPPIPKVIPAGGTFAANTARLALIHVPLRFSLRRLSFLVGVAGATGATAQVGLYDSGLNLLISSGAIQSTSTGMKRPTASTAVSITPGAYYIVGISNDTTLQLAVQDCDISAWGATNAQQFFTATVSGGVLPAAYAGFTGITASATNNFFSTRWESG
jgi:hypothetical protein